MRPKVSVITINFENLSGLTKTFQSVIAQDYPDLEYLVIDGGSKDGTLEFLKENSSKITFWQSEKDAGVYDAMNRGIMHAAGDYLLFLNSGDHFLDQTSLSHLIKNSSGENLVFGDLKVQESDKVWIKTYPDKLNFRYFYFESLPHPACLISKKLFEKIGSYDCKLKIVADWKFFLMAVVKEKCSYRHVSIPIAMFYFDGLSSSLSSQAQLQKERIYTLETYFKWYFRAYSIYLKLIGRPFYH